MKGFFAVAIVAMALPATAFSGPPFVFVENRNQWDSQISFASRIPGGAMTLQRGGFSYIFLDQSALEARHHHAHVPGIAAAHEAFGSDDVCGELINVRFNGSRPGSVPAGFSRIDTYYNFFGPDAGAHASGAAGYQGVEYRDFYEGIGLRLYDHEGRLKYDLVVAPGADPAQVGITYEGALSVGVVDGNLEVRGGLATIVEQRPVSWQVIGGRKQMVRTAFEVRGDEVGFVFPDGYDPCEELIIDPILIFSTYSGSAADNWGSTATPGEKGTLYSAGVTNHFAIVNGIKVFSGTFPATTGAFQTNYGGLFDIGILKYDSLGKTLLYASYLGGSDSESPHSLVVNNRNELILLGTTGSDDFPTTAGAFDRAFEGSEAVRHVVDYVNGADIVLCRISGDGTALLGSTFLGGPGVDGLNIPSPTEPSLRQNYGDELRGDVITDEAGNIYVSTVTSSADGFSALNTYRGGLTDGLVVKLPETLDRITWSLYIGGSGTDAAHSLKLDPQGRVYTAGGTTSADLPVTVGVFQPAHAGDIDGWVARISKDGAIERCTYSGSDRYDQIYFIDLNADGAVYVYGQTSGRRPIVPATIYRRANSGQFLQKFDAELAAQLFYTEFGSGKGTPDISPTAFLVSGCNSIYMAGWGGELNDPLQTSTFGMTTTGDALQRTTAGHDFYFIVLGEDGTELLYATFLGGTLTGTHVDGGTSRFDKQGIVYHAVCAGCSAASVTGGPESDFPSTPGAWSRRNASVNCNNAAFKFDLSSLRSALALRGTNILCAPVEAKFDNSSVGGDRFEWDFGDGSPLFVTTSTAAVSHTYTTPGTYTVWMKAFNLQTCVRVDSSSVAVRIIKSVSTIPPDEDLCAPEGASLEATGGVSYEWKSADGTFQYSGPDGAIQVSPPDTMKYYLTITEASGCVRIDSVMVNVIPELKPEFGLTRSADCGSGTSSVTVLNTTADRQPADLMTFDFGDGTTSDLDEVTHRYSESGTYNVKLIGRREICASEKVVPVEIGTLLFPNVITPAVLDGKNDSFVVQFGDEEGVTPSDAGFNVQLSVYDRWGRPVFEDANYLNNWTGEGLAGGVYYYQITVQDHATCKGWVHVIR